MPPETTRRRYLGAVGTLAGFGLVGTSPGAAGASSPGETDVTTTTAAGVSTAPVAAADCPAAAAVEGDVATATRRIREEEIPALEAEIETARAAWRERNHRLPAAERQRAQAVGEAAREGVVYVRHEYADGFNLGIFTAWYVEPDLLLTNAHNVSDVGPDDDLVGFTVDGRRMTCEVRGLVESKDPDVALLSTDVPGEPLPTGDPTDLEAGTTLVQVGHPGDMGNWVITAGEFLDWLGRDARTYETTVSGMGGNSGSPTLSLDGDVVGMLYGGRQSMAAGGPPTPAPLEVRTEPLPLPKPGGEHVAIDVAIEHAARWSP